MQPPKLPIHSQPLPCPWPSLEAIPGLSALPEVWRSHLGELYRMFARSFLQPVTAPVRFYPCPNECGCAHEVVVHDGKAQDIVAVCRCDEWNCADIPLSTAEIT